MSLFANVRDWRFGWWLLGAAGLGAALYIPIRKALSHDPFAEYKKRSSDLGGDVGIRLQDVTLKTYEGPRLAGTARIGEAVVKKDRRFVNLFGVSQGEYFGDKAKKFSFSADRAEWDNAGKLLNVQSGAKVKNKDMDLVTSEFTYRQGQQVLRMPGPLRGKLFDGQIDAQGLTYELRTDTYATGPATWQGQADTPQDDAPRKWNIKTDGISKRVGDIETFYNAEATDGDIIVRATQVDRNVKTDVITATGNVRYFSKKTNMSCDKAVIYRKEKRAVMTGQPMQMVIKPEDQEKLEVVEIAPLRPIVPESIAKGRPAAPKDDEQKKLDDEVRSSKNRRKYPAIVLCEQVEYWYKKGERRANITGSPQARQELPGGRWRMVWSPKGYYDGEKETLKMFSTEGKKDTRVRTSIGDDLIATWFIVSTKEDDDSWEGNGIEGDVYSDDDEIPREEKKKPADKKGDGGG